VGDTAHVDLHLVALAAGNPQLKAELGSWRLPLIGFGALCTAITVTVFDALLGVVLWIQTIPLLGLLMISKSLAYLAVALIVYRRLPSMAPITSR
jgi:hypothetical protein